MYISQPKSFSNCFSVRDICGQEVKGATKLELQNFFCNRHKLKLSTYKKTSLLFIGSLHLVFSGNPKKTHTDQVYYRFCYSVRKETHQSSKVTTAKNIFSAVYVTVANCFDKYFLFHVITGRHYFL